MFDYIKSRHRQDLQYGSQIQCIKRLSVGTPCKYHSIGPCTVNVEHGILKACGKRLKRSFFYILHSTSSKPSFVRVKKFPYIHLYIFDGAVESRHLGAHECSDKITLVAQFSRQATTLHHCCSQKKTLKFYLPKLFQASIRLKWVCRCVCQVFTVVRAVSCVNAAHIL